MQAYFDQKEEVSSSSFFFKEEEEVTQALPASGRRCLIKLCATEERERGIEASFDRFSARQDDGLEVGRERREVGDRSLYSSYLELSPPIIPIFRIECHIAFPISIRFIIKSTVNCSHYFFICLGGEIITLSLLFQGLG